MKKYKSLRTPYMLTILAICMLLILSIVMFNPIQNVYADYNELNESTLVNFNQMVLNENINRTYIKSSVIPITKKNLNINNHKYYLHFDKNTSGIVAIGYNNGTSNVDLTTPSDTGAFDFIFLCSKVMYFSVYSVVDNLSLTNFNIIDLTLMFGTGNEPNLEQCKEYFTAQYYPYNEGTQIPYSKSYLHGYQEGAQSVYESLSITLNSYTIGANSQTYANNTIERGELYFDQQYSTYAFNGVIAINLLGQVERGTNINIDFKLTIPSLQGEPKNIWESFPLYFAYVDTNNNLVNITGIKANYNGSLDNIYKGDFALPITTSTIYCYLQYNSVGGNLAPLSALATKSDITFKGLDIAQIVNNAYNKGASDTNSKYSPGGLLYQSIYDLGKAEGISEGNSFVNGLDVIATTFTKVFSIFNVEILPGIPLSVFILLPLLFGLIMFVVKIAKGG